MKKAFYLILTGVAVGILAAPRRGSETWKRIRDGFNDWKDGAKDKINDAVSKGKDLVGKANEAVDTAKNETRETVNNW